MHIAVLLYRMLLQAASVLANWANKLWLSCRHHLRQWHLPQLVPRPLTKLFTRFEGNRQGTLTRPVAAGGKAAQSGAEAAEPPVIRFVLDTLFLAASWRYLTAMGQNEVFHYVGGHRLSRDHYQLTQLVPVALVDQSPGGVRADGASSLSALEQLDHWGLVLCGHFDSHPGYGPAATHPSGIDRRFVDNLAAGSYVAIGAICSRDGFFRFYAHDDLSFEVQIIGNQVQEIHDHVFQLNRNLAENNLPIAIPHPPHPDEAGVADRQQRLPGFDTAALQRTTVLLVGCGGLGGEIGSSLGRKGVGRLVFCDHDRVEFSNLNRQHFYQPDLYQPKAVALAQSIAQESYLGTECIGHATGFFEETAEALSDGVDVAVVGVDNNATRCFASQFFGQRGVPVVFTAVNEEANMCWIFVQEAVTPCVACLFPFMLTSLTEPEPCRASPAVIDILKAASAWVTYAVDSLLMDRPRSWDFYDLNLVGDAPNCVDRIKPRPQCPLCGGRATEKAQ